MRSHRFIDAGPQLLIWVLLHRAGGLCGKSDSILQSRSGKLQFLKKGIVILKWEKIICPMKLKQKKK